MDFYQAEGSSRTIRILLLGTTGFFVLIFVVIRQALAITILGLVPIAIVVFGFGIQRRKSLVAVLPPVTEKHPHFAGDGVSGQPYPQAVLYRIKWRNLQLLVVPFASSALSIALVMTGQIKDHAENPLPLYGTLTLLFIGALFALNWLSECRWVARAVGTYAIVQERAILLLCAPDSPRVGLAASSRRYHGFQVIDVKHVTVEQLNAASGGAKNS